MEAQLGLYSENEIKVALIYADSKMTDAFKRLAEGAGVQTFTTSATLEEAAALACQIEASFDVILSRGGTAEYIRKAVNIPVVNIPVTFSDVLRVLYTIRGTVKEVAFFKYGEKLHNIHFIEEICGVKIHEYLFNNHQEIKKGMQDALNRGINVMIGGIVIVHFADQMGAKGVLVECGEETVSRALEEALHVARVRKAERSRSARIEKALDSIAEGIIVTDHQNRITIFNASAERIFHIQGDTAIGKSVQDVIPNTRMQEVFKSGKAELAQLQEVMGGIIATNRIPILLDGKKIGVVGTFEDVTKIQYLEELIRKKIYSKGFVARYAFQDILTKNVKMSELKQKAEQYATTESTVLIQGESGTGKELFAQSIHNASKRKSGPFVAINCAAIPESLLESELFGYEGGAFTGAKREGRPGLFELAHKGTIFLDEIGEIPQPLQARLLRVLQEKEVRRVGDNRIIPVDIRVISATNKDLKKRVAEGQFRDDLYYRLNVLNLKIPPLRDRLEDVPVLAIDFLKRFTVHIPYDTVVKEMGKVLVSYNWPGNIRELSNVMERFALAISYSPNQKNWSEILNKLIDMDLADGNTISLKINLHQELKASVYQFEREIIKRMLDIYSQDYVAVAEKLNIGRSTLWRKLQSERKEH